MKRLHQAKRKGRAFLLRSAAVALSVACVMPQTAFATYAEVSNDYPALQDVTTGGAEIPASKIPDGTYSIEASSSSYMCRFTDCTLAVKNGKMAVTFTMSKAYTRIYIGTAEEAAKHTNADGTDDSAYYKGTPADGYVYHVYTLPISQLNHKMTVSTYAGGTRTCKWFTRTVSFNSTPEIEKAIASGKSPSANDSSKPAENKKQNAGQNKGSTAGGGSTAKKKTEAKGTTQAKGTGPTASAGGSTSSGASGSGTSAVPSGEAKGTVPRASGAAKGSDGGSASGAGSAKAKSGPHVVGITPAQAAALTGDEIPDTGDDAEDAEDNTAFNVALGVVAAAIAACAVVLGASLRRIRKLRTNLGRKG